VISLALSEVEFVDAGGKMLLAALHRAGVDVARGEAAVRPSCAFSSAGHGVGAGSTMSVAG